jgi:hypothetical protein
MDSDIFITDRFASVGIIHWEGDPLDTDEMTRKAMKKS